jgi:hypothetical protein
MLKFDAATMITDGDSPMPHGAGIALASVIAFVGWLAMYLLVK